jgi:hypothetical protein
MASASNADDAFWPEPQPATMNVRGSAGSLSTIFPSRVAGKGSNARGRTKAPFPGHSVMGRSFRNANQLTVVGRSIRLSR